MELLYLWIEDFRSIKKQGFDFSAEFKFKMEEMDKELNNPQLSYKLTISKNENYVNLFDGNVINVTGIIGKNGSGKSTLLHCLKMMSGKLSTLVCPLIFCLRDLKSGTINTYFYNGGGKKKMLSLNVTVEADKSVKQKYEINQPETYTIDRFGVEGSTVKGLGFEFNQIASCYFSNTFDSHRENIYEGIHNISTNFKIENFLKKYISTKEKAATKEIQDSNEIELWPSHILQFHKSELKEFLKFLSYANKRKSNQLNFLPKTLIIEFKLEVIEFFKKEINTIEFHELSEIESILRLVLNTIDTSIDKKKYFKNLIVLNIFCRLVKKGNFYHNSPIKHNLKKVIRNDGDIFKAMEKTIESFSEIKIDSEESKLIKELLGKAFDSSLNKIEFIEKNSTSQNKLHYHIKIENNIWPVLSLIFDLQNLDEFNYIEYSWGGGLSTGEEAFLTHFARLNELKNKLGSKPIWLLIDEGDLYFHPEWQKRYFSELLDYVKFLFPRNKVQIIITTHSPFIASDLPKQNLIFLKQDSEGMCQVANNDIQFETFGSNIHDLFTNSFFLADGLMGEFARSKIAQLIQELNSLERISRDEFESNFKSRIEIIGEPFIQAKLYELVANKTDNSVIDSIIGIRNSEIERLQNLKNRNTND